MADDRPQLVGGLAQKLSGATSGPRATETVKAVSTDPPPGHPLGRDGVGRGIGRQTGMEGGVKASDRGDARQNGPDCVDRRQRRRVVEGSQLEETRQVGPSGVVDQHRVGVTRAAVHHPVSRHINFPSQRGHEITQLGGKAIIGWSQVGASDHLVALVDDP